MNDSLDKFQKINVCDTPVPHRYFAVILMI